MNLIKAWMFIVIFTFFTTGFSSIIFSAPFDNDEGLTPPIKGTEGGGTQDISQTRSSRYIDKKFFADQAQLTVIGGNSYDYCGYSSAFGDINNDGYDDMIIGAMYGDGSDDAERPSSGEVVVYFGGSEQTFPGTTRDIANKQYDLIIYGRDGTSDSDSGDLIGYDVTAGDINGDGFDDIIMGAPGGQIHTSRRDCGAVFVVYGDTRENLGNLIDLATDLDFAIYGPSWEGGIGRAVASGDFNNDGYDDIIVGHPYSSPEGRVYAGTAYIVFGDDALGTHEDLWRNQISPSTVVIIGDKGRTGNDEGDYVGYSVAAGNINGDAFDDIILGAPAGQYDGTRVNAGATYVILGSGSISTSINLSTDARVNIWGDDGSDWSGIRVASGDIDGDNNDDILIGAIYADGQNNNKQSAGDLYVVFGSDGMAQNIDLANNYDMVVWGTNDDDLLGWDIACGNFNGDAFDDFVVGARQNDADDAGITNAGAAYIFYGDTRANLDSNLNPKNEADGHIYGTNESTQLGFVLSSGDFDADGYDDIAVTGYTADGPLNARDDCGEVYLIYGHAPPVRIDSISVSDSSGAPADTVYSRYDTYTFTVNLTMIIGSADLDEVLLTLDPGGADLQYRFSNTLGKFTKVKDADGKTVLKSVFADAKNTGLFYWEIDFELEFEWDFPVTGMLSAEVVASGIRSPESTSMFPDLFSVEDDLVLSGILAVYDNEDSLLLDGGWIAGGEIVAFTGLTPVYEGTTDKYPPDGEFTVRVVDNKDNTWTNTSAPGEPVHIDATALGITDPSSKFKIEISAPPSESTKAARTINLSIDAEDPEPPGKIEFMRTSEDSQKITAVNRTEFYMQWTDGSDKFSGIRGYYYSLVNGEGTKEGTYTTGKEATLTDMPQGQTKIYIWSIDIAGNIGKAATGTIFVDLYLPKFYDFQPAGDDWLTSVTFNCSVKLDDDEGVGVDTNLLRYAISTRGKDAYGSWLQLSEIEPLGGNQLEISVDIDNDFEEGTENWIKFKASDIAGNTVISPDYNLKLDVTPLVFENEAPTVLSKQSDVEVPFTITIRDDISDIDPSSVSYRFSTSGITGYGAWQSENIYPVSASGDEAFGHKFRVDLTLLEGRNNFVQWRAKDNAGNGYTESRGYQIWVNTPPQPMIDQPADSTGYVEGKAIIFSALGTVDADNDTLSYTWRSSIDGEFGYIPEMSYKLSPGVHEITLTISDGISSETARVTIEVKEEDEGLEGKGVLGASRRFDLAFIIIIIIIMILILIAFLRSRKQLKEKEVEARRITPEVLSPRAAASAEPAMAAGLGTQVTDYGLQAGYGTGAQPRPQLPGTGQAVPGFDYAVVSSGDSTAGITQVPPDAAAGVVTPARPQLPPSIGAEYPHLDSKQKMDLLEEKFLTGQVSENLYMQLKEKYTQEIAADAGLETAAADNTVLARNVKDMGRKTYPGEPGGAGVQPGDIELRFKRPSERPQVPPAQPQPPASSEEWRTDEDVLSKIQIPGKSDEATDNSEMSLESMTRPKVKKVKKQ